MKKTILIFIDWYLPGYKAGGPIRSVANIIAHLGNKFNFKIATKDTDYLESKPYENIKSDSWNKINQNTEVYYFSENEITRKNIKNIIKKTEFDTLYINGIYSLYFSILPLYFAKKLNIKNTIIASRGMLSSHAFSQKSKKKKLFLFACKIIGLYKNTTFHATNNDEAESIKSIVKNKINIFSIPNLPRKTEILKLKATPKEENIIKIVSIARISDEKNTLFALEQLKTIKIGQIIFDIYGSIYDKNYWQKCLHIISQLPENIKVTHKGTIESENVIKTFSDYQFSFMPSKGENYGHSILESFMAGTPVITSDNTPWRYLENNKIGWDISLTNNQKFVETIKYCIQMKQDEYNIRSKNAFDFAKKTTDSTELLKKYNTMFNSDWI